MRYVSFEAQGRFSWGVVDGDSVFDLGARGIAASLLDHLAGAGGPLSQSTSSADYQLADIRLNVPVSGSRIFCVGRNYKAHRDEMGHAEAESPSLFTRTWQSVVGAGSPIRRPEASDHYDFEGELACIIGKAGRHISPADALKHVFGYSCFNDGTLRDFQQASLTAGKNFDDSGAFGPWIVDAAEAPAWDTMNLSTRLNGVQVQQTVTDQMIFGLPELIAYISKITTLMPGDVIATGTPSGVGARRTPPLWMKKGDVIAVEIDRIGVLSNPVHTEVGSEGST